MDIELRDQLKDKISRDVLCGGRRNDFSPFYGISNQVYGNSLSWRQEIDQLDMIAPACKDKNCRGDCMNLECTGWHVPENPLKKEFDKIQKSENRAILFVFLSLVGTAIYEYYTR